MGLFCLWWWWCERWLCVSPQDAAPFKAEPSYRGSEPEPEPEPEPEYSTEAAGVPEASSQQGLAYTSEHVYESTEAPDHYQAGTGSDSSHALGREGPEMSFPSVCSSERVGLL